MTNPRLRLAGRVHSIQVGRVAPLGPEGVPSGFVKRDAKGRIAVFELGLEGDEQADLRVHGGPEKAVYAYSLDHLGSWKAAFPGHSEKLVPGAFGENLTVTGLTESDICIGDVHRIGTAVLQVCQPRQPCFKLALHFNDNRFVAAMVRSGHAGWYGLLAGHSPREMFAPRTLMLAIANGAAAIVFILTGLVRWSFGLPMLIGSAIGGIVGAKIGRLLPPVVIRAWTLLITAATTVIFFWHAYA